MTRRSKKERACVSLGMRIEMARNVVSFVLILSVSCIYDLFVKCGVVATTFSSNKKFFYDIPSVI